MRVCLVTPFAWSVPHEVNDHVSGVATELRKLGHTVTVRAPSSKAADLREGRRARADGADAARIARASVRSALRRGGGDVGHGCERGRPSLACAALRHARTLSGASVFAAERL